MSILPYEADMCMMHKIMHGIGGLNHETWFEKASDSVRVTRVTADSLNVKVKNGKLDLRRRLDLRRNFFSVRASSQWNTVPADIKRMMPVHLFKKAYKRHRETTMLAA